MNTIALIIRIDTSNPASMALLSFALLAFQFMITVGVLEMEKTCAPQHLSLWRCLCFWAPLTINLFHLFGSIIASL